MVAIKDIQVLLLLMQLHTTLPASDFNCLIRSVLSLQRCLRHAELSECQAPALHSLFNIRTLFSNLLCEICIGLFKWCSFLKALYKSSRRKHPDHSSLVITFIPSPFPEVLFMFFNHLLYSSLFISVAVLCTWFLSCSFFSPIEKYFYALSIMEELFPCEMRAFICEDESEFFGCNKVELFQEAQQT